MTIRKVLLVDDEDDIRTIGQLSLSRVGGWQTVLATSGAEAVTKAAAEQPDVIVLDVGLPRLDGFEVVDILRQGKGRGTPLIVFTGRELSSGDQHQLTLGITRHLTKARTSEDELLASVRELLNGLLARRQGGEEPRKETS